MTVAAPWLAKISFHPCAGLHMQCGLTFSSLAVRMFEAFLGFPFSNVFPVSSLPTCACTVLPDSMFPAGSSQNGHFESMMT